MAKLLYQGHSSYRITAADGRVIYVDPYVGEGYDVPADFIFVTHDHYDHNVIDLPARKPSCQVITSEQALINGAYQTFSLGGITLEAVEAGNANHPSGECVGYIITLDGVTVYLSGDTSRTRQMETFKQRHLNYAFLCCDGVYNMDLDEAAHCAALIGAQHNIPVHMKPGELFDRARAESFNAPNRLILEPGQEIDL